MSANQHSGREKTTLAEVRDGSPSKHVDVETIASSGDRPVKHERDIGPTEDLDFKKF